MSCLYTCVNFDIHTGVGNKSYVRATSTVFECFEIYKCVGAVYTDQSSLVRKSTELTKYFTKQLELQSAIQQSTINNETGFDEKP